MKSNVLEGFISVAWLFRPISYAEQPHSRRLVISREDQDEGREERRRPWN